jgi:acetyl-CoA carboxylase biotin carboxylase subunit
MFRKILIANRGEIALRIMSACRELDIKTVAVYSEADRNSLHVRFADEAICIGPPRSGDSYLNIPQVISAAEIADVDAIHPGYGFLSENANFAEVCEASHITFIGPTPDAIRLMGEKDKAREAMGAAGLPIIPGSPGVVPDEETAKRLADEIGYPIMIKAAEGGGGRGMRVVRNARELIPMFQTARTEAQGAFGSPNVYMEKLIENPRHIEFQVLGDKHGNVVHLGERECSIQRRHQKVLEESPSMALDSATRNKIGKQVVDALKNLGYSSAGTVEFLREESGNLYFIEMNARIQVEHPVTEMVTGIDLVKSQIRVAAGEELKTILPPIEFRGHAIECRINAEDPETFVPSAGRITAFRVPGGPGIRVDTAAYADGVIPPYYDSLIAKLIAYGKDRAESIARMKCALEGFVVEGIKTTIPLHKRILNDPAFVAGKFDTHFLDRALAEPAPVKTPGKPPAKSGPALVPSSGKHKTRLAK